MRKYTVEWAQYPVNIPGTNLKSYNNEMAFQVYCAHWLRQRYSLTRDDRYKNWHHSANERSNAREGITAKMMGQAKGFPDFVHLGMHKAAELKVKGRNPTADQLDWLAYLRSIDWDARIVRTFEEFQALVLA